MRTETKPWPRVWLFCTLLAALLPVAACRSREPAAALRIPGRGGELRVLLPAEPRGLDPNSPRDEIAQTVAPNLYSTLVTLDIDGRLLPDLAERWTVADGGRTYTFHLRDVRWHDGEPFGSDDVRFTLERLKSHPSLSQEAVVRIVHVDTPDERTIVLRLAEPWAPFLNTLAWGGTYILPRHRADAEGKLPALDSDPVGTGPFQLDRWVRGERLELVASPRFHRPGPFLDRVVYRFVADETRATAMLLRGDADYTVTRISADRVPRLQKVRGVRVVTNPTYSRFYCVFNLRRPPFGDVRVREAVNRAIDRGEMVRKALFGYGVPGFGFYTPAVSWAYNGDAHVPAFDPDRARRLVAEAGAAGAELEMVLPSLEPISDLGDLLRERLRDIGLAVRVTRKPFAEWMEQVARNQDFDLTILAGSHGPDPDNLSFRFGARSPFQGFGYRNPDLDAALEEGARTLDLSRRARAYFRVQEILARDLPIAPIAEAVHFAVFRSHVRGLAHAEGRGLVPPHDLSLVRVRP